MLRQHGIVGMGTQPGLGLVWWGRGFIKSGAGLDDFKILLGSCPEQSLGQSQGTGLSFFSAEKEGNELEMEGG